MKLKRDESTDDIREKILRVLDKPMSLDELSDAVGYSKDAVLEAVRALKKEMAISVQEGSTIRLSECAYSESDSGYRENDDLMIVCPLTESEEMEIKVALRLANERHDSFMRARQRLLMQIPKELHPQIVILEEISADVRKLEEGIDDLEYHLERAQRYKE